MILLLNFRIIEQKQTPQANNNSNANTVEMVPPDGGWGWVVVAGSFLILVGILLYAFSIFLSPILMSDKSLQSKLHGSLICITVNLELLYHFHWTTM
ncbi:hypothetical protein Avbf_08566 [Armadillidium vulgare]|nr:hypothetical protein Avbf_08566 [Armadillidium vulgare]